MTSPFSRRRLVVTVLLAALISSLSLRDAAASRGCIPSGTGFSPPGVVTQFLGPAFIVGTPTGTQNRFLTVLSYFGATRFGHDPRGVFSQLCATGINGVRIFADFWYQRVPGDFCNGGFLPEAYAVIRANGSLNTTPPPNPPANSLDYMSPLEKLKFILRAARDAGLVVDLSFAFEVVQGRSITAHRTGIAALAQQLHDPAYDHVFVDVQNEFNSVGCPRANQEAYVPSLIAAGKNYGAAMRVGFASTAAGDPQRVSNLLTNYNSASGMFAVHEERGGTWWQTGTWDTIKGQITQGMAMGVLAYKPAIYAQEPCAYHYGGCAPAADVPSSSNPNENFSKRLHDSLRWAMERGLAGWVFHTEVLFFPGPGQSLTSIYADRQWSDAELRFLGASGGPDYAYTAKKAVANVCWGQGWIFSSCVSQ